MTLREESYEQVRARGTVRPHDTIKIGVIGPFSGPFALQGKNFKAGIDAYQALNGKTVGDDTIEIVYRDIPTADPAQSAALTQELIVQEGVQYLAGYYFTPDAMAAAPLLEEANVPMVIFNAATSAIVKASPLVVRTSFTLWQTSTPMAKVARDKGIGKVITVVSDYGPGIDAETAFKTAFEAEGRAIVESVRMPMSTADFSPDIFKSLTVAENLAVGLKDRPLSALDEAYEMFPRLKERRSNFGGQLSGGEQQMLTTARTLLGQPSVLLLDEPLEGLAPIICDELMAVLTRFAATGSMTIVLVEQRIRAALEFAERVLILERGRIAWQGTPAELEASPETVDRLLGVGH